MAAYFLDSSALVKRYARETGTAWMLSLFRRAAGNRLYAARITGVETTSALVRKQRRGRLTPTEAARALVRLRRDMQSRLRMVEIIPTVLMNAMSLSEKHGLRGYDAVQLAAVLEANIRRTAAGFSPLVLVAADTELLYAAAQEGFTIEDPNLH